MKFRKLLEKVSIICFVTTLVASIGFVGFVEKSEAKTVKIGSIYSLSGPGSEVNILMRLLWYICTGARLRLCDN